MDSESDGKRTNVEGDRLSSLPDDLIHKILSFVKIKQVVGTSVLSSRWRSIWTSMPYLNFSSEDFRSWHKFSEVVTSVLSGRNDQVEVQSLMLSLDEWVSQEFAKRILNYAFAHNVQDISIICPITSKVRFPLFLFRSQSLKHLTIIGSVDLSVAPTWELPALTTLHLGYFTLHDDYSYDEDEEQENDDVDDDDDNHADDSSAHGGDENNKNIISMCPNLKTLTLDSCKIMRSIGFSICHPQLSNLTLQNGDWYGNLVNVVVPQLKNLIIVNCDRVHLSASVLTSFIYRNKCSLKFSTDNVYSLEEVDLCIRKPYEIDTHDIVGLLQQFHNVKSLSLNLEIIELLSSLVELISNQPSLFAKLRSLKIYPVNIQLEADAQKKAMVSNFVKSYFLGGSPSASFASVTREEIKASDIALVRHLMAELRLKLEWVEAAINWDDMEGGKELTGDAYLDELISESKFEESNKRDIKSKLKRIEGLMTKLPTSNRAKMQLAYDRLDAEANSFMEKKLSRTREKWEEEYAEDFYF